jgi:hypothetical protein
VHVGLQGCRGWTWLCHQPNRFSSLRQAGEFRRRCLLLHHHCASVVHPLLLLLMGEWGLLMHRLL